MIRFIPALAGLALLAGCTAAQQQAAITLAASAMPCYDAVVAAIGTGSNATKALTAADIVATSPACVGVDQASLTLIASALNTGAKVATGAASAPAAVRAPTKA